ncbi:DUF3293 domain-containing protein [Acidithiobacillus sp. IBUN Pt1247-S3]|uniref:DUF3293 domain-containing protein n=1 Tax=Acidithiobacillus sp. IBUN Pt1247-S3 TaxID=3166642 RepID=UPI0034E5851D
MIYRNFLLKCSRSARTFARRKKSLSPHFTRYAGRQTLPPRELQHIYITSCYIIEHSNTRFAIDAPTRRRGAVLSAWNPGSYRHSEYTNRKRDRRLLRLLRGQRWRGMWGGKDTWWERHYWVPELPLELAARISMTMDQKAFLFLDGRHVRLIWCYT